VRSFPKLRKGKSAEATLARLALQSLPKRARDFAAEACFANYALPNRQILQILATRYR
jgi:hypothetical protein